jgi:hypothetical protein
MTEDQKPDWNIIEAEYRAAVDSVRAIAERHGVNEGSIRNRAKKGGWQRSGIALKREIVNAAMAGITQVYANVTHDMENSVCVNIRDAALEDINDGRRALFICRQLLVKLESNMEAIIHPKDIKAAVEAASAAYASIQKIRGLDNPPGDSGGEEQTHEELIAEAQKRGLPTQIFEK